MSRPRASRSRSFTLRRSANNCCAAMTINLHSLITTRIRTSTPMALQAHQLRGTRSTRTMAYRVYQTPGTRIALTVVWQIQRQSSIPATPVHKLRIYRLLLALRNRRLRIGTARPVLVKRRRGMNHRGHPPENRLSQIVVGVRHESTDTKSTVQQFIGCARD